MKTFIGFLVLLNFIYFLWPKDEALPRTDFKRGDPGVAMLLQINEQSEPPSPQSLVPTIFDPLVTKAPVIQVINASARMSERDIENTDIEDSAEIISITDLGKEPPQEPQASADPSAEKRAAQCFTLGPFKQDEAAQKALADLTVMGLQSGVRDAKQRRTRGFWVYLPSYPSREKAIAEAEKLASQGFTDYFIVSDGKRDNAISLGLFNLKSGSERRVKELSALGYTPKVEARSDEVTVFWVDTQAEKEINWVDFVKERFPAGGVENLERPCGEPVT